jgi:hypothetical protein
MKLYTEEQVIEAYNKGRTDWINELEDNNILYTMIPIELPSDEEIEEYLQKTHTKAVNPLNVYYRTGFEKGAKWMKEQILNQNK